MNSTNLKATVLLAFNTFVLSSIVLKSDQLLKVFPKSWDMFVLTFLSIFFICCTVSLFFTLLVIMPYLKSPSELKKYHSDIFFGHISDYPNPDDYFNSIKKSTEEEKLKDLSFQVHAVATGLNKKFRMMLFAFIPIVYVLFPSVIVLVIFRIILFF
ncbi:MAG TPA: Pycsar system effector family protein [Ignavibacteriaceae bacterium]|nr:Pycsar system effector family protein [Ignavibacteriaceae bacterium]